ncbi:hypothetical protein PUN28_007101 [Cardiocondyla obscurior]|uniref:Uncharacterized protein n=1 Tax=Cardiocondyla obscurior TaxID=286306 RepID=A0AAW2G4H3_9HYME
MTKKIINATAVRCTLFRVCLVRARRPVQSRKSTRRKRRIMVGRENRQTVANCRHRSVIGLRPALRSPRCAPTATKTDRTDGHYPYRGTEFGASVRSVAPDADPKQRPEKLLRVVHSDSCQRALRLLSKIREKKKKKKKRRRKEEDVLSAASRARKLGTRRCAPKRWASESPSKDIQNRRREKEIRVHRTRVCASAWPLTFSHLCITRVQCTLRSSETAGRLTLIFSYPRFHGNVQLPDVRPGEREIFLLGNIRLNFRAW